VTDALIIFLLIVGTLFALLAAVAVLRMPDLYTRMHGATKSATLGVGCTILAVAIQFANMETATAAVLIIGFLFMTAPVAAHMIGRAAYRLHIPKWTGTVIDESPQEKPSPQGATEDGVMVEEQSNP